MTKDKDVNVEFFGDVDRNKNNEITSELPAWFHREHLSILEEDADQLERQIERGDIPKLHISMTAQEIKTKREKIADIKAAIPKFTGANKNKISEAYFKLKNQIADSLPTHMENRKGYTQPREELDRMKSFHIPVDKDLAKACNVKTNIAGKVSGDGANKMFKMFGRILGENENVERIRKEGKSESKRDMEDFTKHILKELASGRERA